MKRLLLALLLFAGCQKTAPLAVAPHRVPPSNLRVAENPLDARRIKAAGPLHDSVLLAVEPGIAGDRVSTLVEVPAAQCVVVIARGSETVEDLDLLAYGEDGAPLGSDEAPDREPSLLICPPHPVRIVVSARVAQGHGLVAVGAEQVSQDRSEKLAQRYAVKPRNPNDPARLKAWPGLDAMIIHERERVGGKVQDLRRVALALDASAATTLPASIDAGGCVHGLFVPSDDVAHLDVAVLDDQGRILGRAVGSGRQRSVVVCSPIATEVSFEVRPHAGRGLAVAALSRSVPGTESEIDAAILRRDVYPTRDLAQELEAARERLKKLGYRPGATSTKIELNLGRRSSSRVELGNGCTRLDLVGGSPLRGVDARLWSDGGALRAAGAGGGGVTLFACGAGRLRLDTAAVLGPGPVAVLLQREADVPAELIRWPLAGGRLLSRMLARGVLLRASAVGKVTEHALSAEQLTTFSVLVPLDRCLDINAVEQETELELDSAVGENAASARLCAYGRDALGSLNARIELRAVSGTGRALAATRLLSPAD